MHSKFLLVSLCCFLSAHSRFCFCTCKIGMGASVFLYISRWRPFIIKSTRMTFLHKLVTGFALVGIALAPVTASAREISVPKDWGAKKMEQMKKVMERPGLKIGVKAKVDGDALAGLDNEARAIVAKVRLLINAYRKSTHEADVQYKKSVHGARNTLTHALKAAIKAKDKAAGYSAFEAYSKAEGEAEVKRDAAHAEARVKFMTDLKVLLG